MFTPKRIPLMSCVEAKSWEKRFFDPARSDGTEPVPQEADFMERAGKGIGEFIIEKLHGNTPHSLIVLVGKGHNGGDALIATLQILRAFPRRNLELFLVFFANSWDDLAPLTMDAYEALLRERKKPPTFFLTENSVGGLAKFLPEFPNVVIDGIYGHGFRPPLQEHVFKAIILLNERSRGSLRIAVDLPSGLSDTEYTRYAFVADFTCATGIVKTPLLAEKNASYVGRIVPVDIGFPAEENCICAVDTKSVLATIPMSRPIFCDKRSFGHLVIVGGSRNMPGALMLNTLAALRAGAGFVTVLCPESVHAAFAARAPAAMWIPCKEAEDGSLDCADAFEKLQKFFSRANTILCGSGMGNSENSQELIKKIARETPENIALILDADALRTGTLFALRKCGENVLLPHLGEFLRMGGIAGSEKNFCEKNRVTLALKGAYTRVSNSAETLVTFAGTPALARGGSGDLLAGTVAAIFASRDGEFEKKSFGETEDSALLLLLAGTVWHGAAAESLAESEGIRTADITHLPDYFFRAAKF